jgi:hypothetical protein
MRRKSQACVTDDQRDFQRPPERLSEAALVPAAELAGWMETAHLLRSPRIARGWLRRYAEPSLERENGAGAGWRAVERIDFLQAPRHCRCTTTDIEAGNTSGFTRRLANVPVLWVLFSRDPAG